MKKHFVISFAVFSFLLLFSLPVLANVSIVDFELEIELKDGQKYDLEYEVKPQYVVAKYRVPNKETIYGAQAQAAIEALFQEVPMSADASKRDLKNSILNYFSINNRDVKDFEIDIEFSDETKLEFER
ncbi:YusW family protein [Alkalihalobacillus sp. 1P02AB]|uniref:YusW family protein n=1 Tax=Alkalihalobacillus sp. 1P02AB TaxID=3132260 RepID=UPI0039A4C247